MERFFSVTDHILEHSPNRVLDAWSYSQKYLPSILFQFWQSIPSNIFSINLFFLSTRSYRRYYFYIPPPRVNTACVAVKVSRFHKSYDGKNSSEAIILCDNYFQKRSNSISRNYTGD